MKSEELKKSTLLESLERIESLVDMAFKMSVRQSINGLSLAIVAECAYAYRLAIDASFRHMKYIYIDEDVDVDGETWRKKLQTMSRRLEIFKDENAYNGKALSHRNIVSILSEQHELSSFYKTRHYERTSSIENNANNYGHDCFRRMEEEYKCNVDAEQKVKIIYGEIEKETYDLVGTDIFNPLLSPEDNKKYLHEQMAVWDGVSNSASKALWKLSFCLNLLKQARDIRRIPDYMFEDFCQIQTNKATEEFENAIINLDNKLNQYSKSSREGFLRNEIRQRFTALSEVYSAQTISSFIDSEYIDNKSQEFKGCIAYGVHSAKMPVIPENLGRFIYGMFYEHKGDEAGKLFLDVCMLAQCMQKLKEIIYPPVTVTEWPAFAHEVFLDEVEIDGIKYKVNLETIYNLCKTYLEKDVVGRSTDCRWLALLLFAKQWGILKYKHQQKGNDAFEISTFVNFLNEWNFDVKANKISPYKYLLMSDEITDFFSQKLSVIAFPEGSNPNTRNKTGVENIQRFLNLLLENCTKQDIFYTSNVN